MAQNRTKVKKKLESIGRAGQRSQAEEVNKRRGSDGAILGKWTFCTVKMPKDKNALTPSNLPVMICGTLYFKNSDSIRYR
jgi:hypothetical protein